MFNKMVSKWLFHSRVQNLEIKLFILNKIQYKIQILLNSMLIQILQ